MRLGPITERRHLIQAAVAALVLVGAIVWAVTNGLQAAPPQPEGQALPTCVRAWNGPAGQQARHRLAAVAAASGWLGDGPANVDVAVVASWKPNGRLAITWCGVGVDNGECASSDSIYAPLRCGPTFVDWMGNGSASNPSRGFGPGQIGDTWYSELRGLSTTGTLGPATDYP
jgi:hypothetical protein